MKYLLIFLFLTSCGKHSAPAQKDLRDSDGDGTSNYYDSDKHKADIVKVEVVNAEMEFEVGTSQFTKHRIKLSNNIDLQAFSRNLMVRKWHKELEDDFFSEFSILKLKSNDLDIPNLNGSTRIQLIFSKVQTAPKILLLISKSKRIRLGDWKESMDFNLTQDDLESILRGEAFFSLSHMDGKTGLQNQSQEELIRERNHRVIFNDGKSTEVHYISKELSIDKVLEKLNVPSYQFIDFNNLLTTSIKPEIPEWWVRYYQNDIIIVKENLRDLSNHYLKGFSKTEGNVTRINGFSKTNLSIKNPSNSRVLLKIRAEQRLSTFSEKRRDNRTRIGGRDNYDKFGCMDYTRIASPEFISNSFDFDFTKTFIINGLNLIENQNATVKYSSDEGGVYWEIQLNGAEDFTLSLVNSNVNDYVQIGLFKSVMCLGDSRNAVYSNNLQVPERSLTFQVEAFVENI